MGASSVEKESECRGCNVQISTFAGKVLHELRGLESYPTIRSYSDGLKVGCTFVTNAALEKIYAWHKEFLGREESRTHQ